MYIYICVCMCMYVCMYVCMCVCVCKHVVSIYLSIYLCIYLCCMYTPFTIMNIGVLNEEVEAAASRRLSCAEGFQLLKFLVQL